MDCWHTIQRIPLRWSRLSLLLLAFSTATVFGAEPPAVSPDDEAHCPSPPVPAEALFLGEWGDLELTIVADPEGKILSATVSKPSEVKLFDERVRDWVEKNWRMGRAKEGRGGPRTFKAPIVFHGADRFPQGGKFPPPSYPWKLLQKGVQGSLAVTIKVEPSGMVESASVFVGSGSRELDEHTTSWVKKRWRFPALSQGKVVYWVCHYRRDSTYRLPMQTGPPAGVK